MKQPPSRSLSLKLTPRPLRFAYLVRDRADFMVAVRLLTHTWGGKGSLLLPRPNSDSDRDQLRSALAEADPDVIIVTADTGQPDLTEFVARLPWPKRQLSIREIDEFISGVNPWILSSGEVPRSYSVLQEQYPSGLGESRIRIVEHDGPFGTLSRIIWGDPSDSMAAWLQRAFNAEFLRAPQKFQDLVRSSLIGSTRVTPLDVSLAGASPSLSYRGFEAIGDPLRGPLIQDKHSIFLFLDDGESLSASCSYWNARAAANGNKLLLPLDYFRAELPEVLRSIRSARRVDNIIVIAEMEEMPANDLLAEIRKAISDLNGGDDIAILRSGFRYSIPPFRFVSSHATAVTVAVSADDEVRFVAPKPRHFPTTGLFGWDAEVTRPDGEKLSLPVTAEVALLLSNSVERIRRFEDNEGDLGALWLRQGLPVRARRDGIAAVATPETESVWYLPAPHRVIAHALRARGVTLTSNRHTRYAAGVVNRLGGFDTTMAFVRAGGLIPMKALLSRREAQAGLHSQHIESLIRDEGDLGNEQLKRAMTVHFPRLLATGLVRRGFALSCDHCDLKEWYGVAALSEFVECAGCGELFQLRGRRLHFSYKLNELARRMLSEGGFAVLSTAAALDAIGSGQNIVFGGNLKRGPQQEPFAEIDLFSLKREAFVIAECKDCRDATTASFLTEASESLRKSVAAAPMLGAQVVVLGITTDRWDTALFDLVSVTATQVAASDLAVHLVMNGLVYLSGNPTAMEAGRISFTDLLPKTSAQEDRVVVGSLPRTFGVGSSTPAVDGEVIDAWESSALARPYFAGDTV